ncbi:MAG: glyoxalase [Bacteroidetes bacterium]|nr:glyoxalase [Bacteroidota bacterium]
MKLDYVEILTNDLKATKSFYEKVLELPIIKSKSEFISFKIGTSTLKLVKNIEETEPIYHLAFNIPKNKLNEVTEWSTNRVELIKKDDTILIAEFETWNANAVYFYDNNNNLLEFIARKDLNNSETEIFNSKQILNISEIGIVKKNPLEFGNQLIEKYGLNLFEKNQNSEMFTAIGDDNGILIIVKANRNWYPTEIPAKSNWTKIGLTNKDKSITIEVNG